MSPVPVPPPVTELVHFYEQLQRDRLPELARWYAPDAQFKDPFNTVQGVAAITRIFEHMFDQLHKPRFVVTERVVQDAQCFVVWDFHFQRGAGPKAPALCIRGCTHWIWNAQGQVVWHRDYWDAAEELYEKWPVLGAILRALRRRLQAP